MGFRSETWLLVLVVARSLRVLLNLTIVVLGTVILLGTVVVVLGTIIVVLRLLVACLRSASGTVVVVS